VIAYFDTSALVKLVKAEQGSREARALWDRADAVLTSQLTYPEARSALRVAVGSGELSHTQHPATIRELDDLWFRVSASGVDAQIATSAGGIVDRNGLRGADAIHLSTAIVAARDDFLFVTWDRRLAESALAEGLPVAPA
jgi:predicted nucleic acid-binding protein